jgi:hypothetical protein
MELVRIQKRSHPTSVVGRRLEPRIVETPHALNPDGLPRLSDGFSLHLDGDDWAALFPRHHLMWVSRDARRG